MQIAVLLRTRIRAAFDATFPGARAQVNR